MLLMPTFSLPASPPQLTLRLRRCRNAPLPIRMSDIGFQISDFYFAGFKKIFKFEKFFLLGKIKIRFLTSDI